MFCIRIFYLNDDVESEESGSDIGPANLVAKI